VVNATGSGLTLSTLNLTGPNGITGFDGDGLQNPTYGAPVIPGSHGYEGPGTSYSNITSTSLTVNFDDGTGAGLPSGMQTYFSLELPPSSLNLLITAAPNNQTSVEGASHLFNLGLLSDSGPGPWSVTVHWGDSTTTTFSQTTQGTITPQSHIYAEEGSSYAASVTVTDTTTGLSSTANFTNSVTDPAVVAHGVAVSATEGLAFTNVTTATFTDPAGPEPVTNYPTTIGWGDGSSSTGTVTNVKVGYQFDITTFYQFGGSAIGGVASPDTGFFTVANDGTSTFTGTIAESGTANGNSVVISGSFTGTLAPGQSVTFAAGPGTGLPTDSSNNGGYNGTNGIRISLTGTVAQGGFSEAVSLAVFDKDIHSGVPRDVHAAPSAETGAPLFSDSYVLQGGDPTGGDTQDDFETSQAPGHFSFTEQDQFTVTGSHTYGEEGPYTVTTTIGHTTPPTVATSTATVADPAVLQGPAVAITAKEAIAFTNKAVAQFTDPGGAEPNPSDPTPGISNHYSVVSIDWGDGSPLDTTSGSISYSGAPGSKTAPFTVSGSHTYAEEGTHTVTIIISHEGVRTTLTSTATIRDNYGLLVLDPTDPQALKIDGNGSVTVNHSGAVVVDSSDPSAIFLSGHAALQAAETDVTGGLVTHGPVTFSGELNHEAATPDPLGLGLPPMPSPHITGVHLSSGTVALLPGTYDGGITVDGTAIVTLAPGIYYMNGGGFSVSGQGSVTGTHVLIVNAPLGPSDSISLSGQAVVSLSPPTGSNSVTILQTAANPISVTGQASLTMTGILYAPAALLKIDGNGAATVSTDTPSTGGEVIVFEAMVTGNGDLVINADPPAGGAGGLINYPGRPQRADGPGTGGGPAESLLLTGGQSAAGNSLSQAPVTRSGAGTAAAGPTSLDQLFAGSSGGTRAAVLSAASRGMQPGGSMGTWVDPLSGQLADELVSNLVGLA
jgi:hypothetical protein